MRNHKASCQRGFTLLEILIALFIFTIVSIIMVTTLHSVFESQTLTEKKATQMSELQMALLLISRDLEQSIDRPVLNAKNMLDGAMLGSHDQVTFTHGGLKNPNGKLLIGSLQRTEYTMIDHELIRRTWEVLDQAAKTLPTTRVLYHGVSDLRFEYLDKEGKFQNNWPNNSSDDALPVAIRISLSVENWGKITQLYLLKGQNVQKTQ
jgi:general secretion pathway protein J